MVRVSRGAINADAADSGRGGAEWPRLWRGGVDAFFFFFFFPQAHLDAAGVKGPLSAGGALFSRRCSGTELRQRCTPAA